MIKCKECNEGIIQMVGLLPVAYNISIVDGDIDYGDYEILDGINDVEYQCNHCGVHLNSDELV